MSCRDVTPIRRRSMRLCAGSTSRLEEEREYLVEPVRQQSARTLPQECAIGGVGGNRGECGAVDPLHVLIGKVVGHALQKAVQTDGILLNLEGLAIDND